MSRFKLLTLSAVVVAGLASVPASALVTFASFSQADSANNVRYSNGALFTALNGIGAPSSVNVLFNFLIGGNAVPQGVSASYTFNGLVPAGILPGSGAFNLSDASGAFSFLSNEAITTGGRTYAAGSNLLSGSFGSSFLDGTVDGTSGVVRGSTSGGATISYSSAFLNFSDVSEFDFSLPLTAVLPPFGSANGKINDFSASMGGQFSSEPSPTFGAVPEPTTWAMMIIGFGLVGVTARRRNLVSVAA